MIWVSLWFALLTSAAAILALLGARLFRQAKTLTGEFSLVAERLSALPRPGSHGRRRM